MVTAVLNYEEIKKNPEIVSNIKPFQSKFNWKGINYPSKIDDWKMFEKNNPTIAPNVSYIKEKEICPTYIWKINSNCEKQIILLMIPNQEKKGWYYLTVKKLSALSYGITLKHKGDFYCFNWSQKISKFSVQKLLQLRKLPQDVSW